jgi:hypothetical protein
MVIVLLLTIIVNSSYVQSKLIGLATDAISKELDAEVKIDHVSVNLLAQHASFYDITLKDKQQRDMLKIKEVWGSMRIRPLLRKQFILRSIKINDIDLLIVKPDSGEANYQFLIDATKKKEPHQKKEKKGSAMKFDLNHAIVNDIRVKYNHETYSLDQANYQHINGKHSVTLHHLKADWKKYTRKGIVDWNIDSGLLTVNVTDDKKMHVEVHDLILSNDNHRPRRNTGKPNHGAFDGGHLNVITDLSIDVLHISKDTITARLTRGCAKDTIAGIDLTNLKTDVTIIGKEVSLTNTVIQQTNTRLDIPKAEIMLPDKKKGTTLSYNADTIYGRAILKDIAQPFAPVLRNFSIPLNLRVGLKGSDQGMNFRGIHVNSDDKKLEISATGNLRNLTDSRKLTLYFQVHDMVAKPGIKDKIVNQFTVKKYMMNQLYALGVIKYHGSFDILWKKQIFRGLMNTEMGKIDFNFELDGNTKYLTGKVSTDSVNLGDLFQLKKLGDIACTASFHIDISKERTAKMRKIKGGKLPIGNVNADIRKVKYKRITLKNIMADIESDGALASGDVTMKGKLTDLMLQFSFTNTNEMHKMKVKPKLKFRKYVKDD